jgi:hypothetical protein
MSSVALRASLPYLGELHISEIGRAYAHVRNGGSGGRVTSLRLILKGECARQGAILVKPAARKVCK